MIRMANTKRLCSWSWSFKIKHASECPAEDNATKEIGVIKKAIEIYRSVGRINEMAWWFTYSIQKIIKIHLQSHSTILWREWLAIIPGCILNIISYSDMLTACSRFCMHQANGLFILINSYKKSGDEYVAPLSRNLINRMYEILHWTCPDSLD